MRLRPLALCVLMFAGSACGVGLSNRAAPPAGGAVDKTPAAGGSAPTSDKVGINDLSERERDSALKIAESLFAPCPEHAVTLKVCVDEARDCAACKPMLDLVASQVADGVPEVNVKAAAMTRFSAEASKAVPDRAAFSLGPAEAKVKIVAYSDFQCPACKATFPKLEAVQKAFPQDVRLEHRFYPLAKHPRAKAAALAAVAAGNQQKFFAMEKLIFENQTQLEDQDLEEFAEDIGLDMGRFQKDRASEATLARVEQDIQDAEKLGLTHTPFVLINGRVFDTAYFRIDRDLESWIRTEIALTKARPAAAPAVVPAPAPAVVPAPASK